ncbi:MAG: HD domain-containing protein [Spirochaetaceae bacterium]|nr:HD domain-containing protein [Spirochaetaceae bacterium]
MDYMDLIEIPGTQVDRLLVTMSPHRREHSLSVANVAEQLCARFGIEASRGRYAGLAHDVMKERGLAEQWSLAREGAREIGDPLISRTVREFELGEAFGGKMIHGPAAAGYLYIGCGLRDIGILEAVALHSSAFPDMKPLSKITYVADKLEPRRSYVGPADAEALATLELDELFFFAMEHVIGYLTEKGYRIAQSTLDLYNSLKVEKASK